jgi:hypothetical protein
MCQALKYEETVHELPCAANAIGPKMDPDQSLDFVYIVKSPFAGQQLFSDSGGLSDCSTPVYQTPKSHKRRTLLHAQRPTGLRQSIRIAKLLININQGKHPQMLGLRMHVVPLAKGTHQDSNIVGRQPDNYPSCTYPLQAALPRWIFHISLGRPPNRQGTT